MREESAERGKRQRRWQEAHGTPLGFIFCVVRGGLLAGEQVNFSTFYTTEIMRGEVSMSPLYRSEHGARFERLMNTPIEDLVGAENVPKVYQ